MFNSRFLRSCLAPPCCELCPRLIEEPPGLCAACAGLWVELSLWRCELCADPFAGQGLSAHRCGVCLQNPPSFEKVHAAVEFDGSAVGLLHALKFGGRRSALGPLAEKGAPHFRAAVETCAPDFLVAMPLGWSRRRRRGFNQSYLLLRALSRGARIEVPVWRGGRRRTREPQARLDRGARQRVLAGSFLPLKPGSLAGRRILLVDDVLTTGATAESFSKCLLQAGARSVQVFAFARARRKGSF
ncbi:MAG TPA: ComF family protein [bacterium]|nr:ComF family protein [bacterium]